MVYEKERRGEGKGEREREREREREKERESCEAVFSSLGAFVLRGQENSAGKIIFLFHSSPPLRRCVQQPC